MGLFHFRSAVDVHFGLLDAINHAKNDRQLEKLCLKDIAIAEKFNREWVQKAKREARQNKMSRADAKRHMQLPKSYPSFKHLAILYEHRQEYEKAIDVCKKAIKAGYPDDGTQTGMTGRLRKLEEKAALYAQQR